MKLYQAIDALDDTDSFFLVYPDGRVAVMPHGSLEAVKGKESFYLTEAANRFQDAINPVLLAEWN